MKKSDLRLYVAIGIFIIGFMAALWAGNYSAYQHALKEINKGAKSNIDGYFDPTLSTTNPFLRLSSIPSEIGRLHNIEQLYATQLIFNE